MSRLCISSGIKWELPVREEEQAEPTKNSKPKDKKNIPYLQASMFATILEDVIMEMRILTECNNAIRVAMTMSDMGTLLASKYEIAEPEVKDELEGIDSKTFDGDIIKFIKLDNDRKLISTAIISVYIDLIENKTSKALKDSINMIINLDNYRLVLFEKEVKNKVLRRELNKQLRQQRNHIKSALYDNEATIDILRSTVEDTNLNAEIRNRYVERWQQARTEQHLLTIQEEEGVPASIIDYYKQRIESEQRVHTEVELLMSISINETLEKVDNWMTKYDKDMENIDLKIQIRKNDYQNMLDQRISLEEMFVKHDELIKEWIHFKEEREKTRIYREKMTKAAIIVQAWWRGLLVRRQLGPYKVSKKKKANKK